MNIGGLFKNTKLEKYFILIKNLHYICENLNPLSQFEELNEHVGKIYQSFEEGFDIWHDEDIEEYDKKQQQKIKRVFDFRKHYTNRMTGKELLVCLSEMFEEKIIPLAIKSENFIGLALDEATDIASNDNLIYIIKFVDPDGNLLERFLHL